MPRAVHKLAVKRTKKQREVRHRRHGYCPWVFLLCGVAVACCCPPFYRTPRSSRRGRKASIPRPGRPATPTPAAPAWPGATCPNVSRSWNSALDTCQKYGAHDDGLQALPRRGFKSRILHHSTNQGSVASHLFSSLAVSFGPFSDCVLPSSASFFSFYSLFIHFLFTPHLVAIASVSFLLPVRTAPSHATKKSTRKTFFFLSIRNQCKVLLV